MGSSELTQFSFSNNKTKSDLIVICTDMTEYKLLQNNVSQLSVRCHKEIVGLKSQTFTLVILKVTTWCKKKECL